MECKASNLYCPVRSYQLMFLGKKPCETQASFIISSGICFFSYELERKICCILEVQNFKGPICSKLVLHVFGFFYAREIWKRLFQSENASYVFRPRCAGKFENAKITGPLECVFEESLGREITWLVWPSFSKSSVFKTFSFHTKTQSQCFQIPPVWRAFSKSFVFVTDL